MAHVSATNYTRMAEAAADDLITQAIPLNDSIAKLASTANLNHEQVHRLCEATNNVAFNKMFKAHNKTATDRIVDFPVADASVILGTAIKTASYAIEEPAALDIRELRELPDPVEPEVKTASFEMRPEVPARPEVEARAISKALDTARHDKLAALQTYEDSLGDINQAFKRVYHELDYDKFASVALSIHADSAAVLDELRHAYGLTYSDSVQAKTAGVVDDSHATFGLLKVALERYNTVRGLHFAVKKLEQL